MSKEYIFVSASNPFDHRNMYDDDQSYLFHHALHLAEQHPQEGALVEGGVLVVVPRGRHPAGPPPPLAHILQAGVLTAHTKHKKIMIIIRKNFNRHSHHGSKCRELAQHVHSHGSHALTQHSYNHVAQSASSAITEFGIKFYLKVPEGETVVRVFPSQKCCADSLSVCPTNLHVSANTCLRMIAYAR